MPSSSQTPKDELYKTLPHTSFAEKVYLQLDKTIYESNETIWFKAIVTDALNNIPTKLSSVLYVELINESKEIINSQLLKLTNGITSGAFNLNNYNAGVYLIRAHTKWNENFDAIFMYNQYIHIYDTDNPKSELFNNITLTQSEANKFSLSAKINPLPSDSEYKEDLKLHLSFEGKEDSIIIKKGKTLGYSFNYPIPEGALKATLTLRINEGVTASKTIAINKDYLNLRFFPEGGDMVHGLKSTVGFKAVDYTGHGLLVQGDIVDENGELVTSFKSNHLGMGKINLLADSNKQYFGKIKNGDGTIVKYPLPKISSSGIVLHVTEDEAHINVSINTNTPSTYEDVSLRVRCRGFTHYYSFLKLKDNQVIKQLLKSEFPEGILEITIFNSSLQPICERLFFNDFNNNPLNISVKTDQDFYLQRDKTNLTIEVTDKSNTPINANLSVLVINKALLGSQQEKRQNIRSYLLLESELKGTIESPGYYFNTQIKNDDLDALMLTQGWRKYNYKPLDKLLSIKPESGLSVSGGVGGLQNEKKSDQFMDLTLLTFGNQAGFYTQHVDSTFRFNFTLNDIYSNKGFMEVLFQAKNKNGKQKNYTINMDKKHIPKITFNQDKTIEKVDTIINAYIEKSVANKQPDPFKLAYGTIELNEVLLDGYKLSPEREKMMDLHGKPDVVIENKELVKKIKNWSYGLYSILLFNYPGEIDIRRVKSDQDQGDVLMAQVVGADYTYYLVDGNVVLRHQFHLLPDLPTEEIKSVEIIRHPKNKGKYYLDLERHPMFYPGDDDAFIAIYTNSGNGIFGAQKTVGISKDIIPVFSDQKEFYTPIYDVITDQDWKEPDLRSLVHWEPILQTNTLGKATVEYYNSDAVGDMLIVVESISDDGRMGYHDITYSIKEH